MVEEEHDYRLIIFALLICYKIHICFYLHLCISEFENLVSHEGDEVSRKIENIMHQIEEMLKNSGSQLHDSEISKLLRNMPTNCGEQQYGQWAVNLRNQVRRGDNYIKLYCIYLFPISFKMEDGY